MTDIDDAFTTVRTKSKPIEGCAMFGRDDTEMNEEELRWALRWAVRDGRRQYEQMNRTRGGLNE